MPSSHSAAITDTATAAVNLRMRKEVRTLIDRAARARGKTRTEFMIDAALRSAEETLLDQTLVRVDAATYAQFIDILDRAADSEGFRRLLNVRKPWAS
jgi:uncharacterized protein (DUF1778 family)